MFNTNMAAPWKELGCANAANPSATSITNGTDVALGCAAFAGLKSFWAAIMFVLKTDNNLSSWMLQTQLGQKWLGT